VYPFVHSAVRTRPVANRSRPAGHEKPFFQALGHRDGVMKSGVSWINRCTVSVLWGLDARVPDCSMWRYIGNWNILSSVFEY